MNKFAFNILCRVERLERIVDLLCQGVRVEMREATGCGLTLEQREEVARLFQELHRDIEAERETEKKAEAEGLDVLKRWAQAEKERAENLKGGES